MGAERVTRRIHGALERLRSIRAFTNWRDALRAMYGRGPGRTRLITRGGLELTLRGDTTDYWMAHEVFCQRAYRDIARLLRRHPGATVIDAGAHVGCFSLLAAANGARRVIAYEPASATRTLLIENIEANGLHDRIEVRPEALGASDGREPFAFDTEDPSGSRLHSLGDEVPVVSLPRALAEAAGLDVILKLDVEGAEYRILQATDAADWAPIAAVMVELHADPAGRSSAAMWLADARRRGLARTGREGDTHVLERAARA